MTRIEWHNRPDFAEMAEALGVSTDRVIAAHLRDGTWAVLYSGPNTEDRDGPVFGRRVEPDVDGILRATGPEVVAGTVRDLIP